MAAEVHDPIFVRDEGPRWTGRAERGHLPLGAVLVRFVVEIDRGHPLLLNVQ